MKTPTTIFLLSLLAAYIAIAVLLTGCASFSPPASSTALHAKQPYFFDYAADRRGAVLIPTPKGGTLLCSEPVPRVAQSVVLAAQAAVTGQSVKGGVGAGVKPVPISDEVMVLFLREAMYRLCELSINLASLDAPYRAPVLGLYTEVVQAAVNLSGTTENAELARIKAKSVQDYLQALTVLGAQANTAQTAGLQRQLTALQHEVQQLGATPKLANPVSEASP